MGNKQDTCSSGRHGAQLVGAEDAKHEEATNLRDVPVLHGQEALSTFSDRNGNVLHLGGPTILLNHPVYRDVQRERDRERERGRGRETESENREERLTDTERNIDR